LHATIDVELVQREVEGGSRQFPDVGRHAAGSGDPVADRPRKQLATGAVVPPDGQPGSRRQASTSHRGDRTPNRMRETSVELVTDDTPDIVFAKDGGRDIHRTTLAAEEFDRSPDQF
jgi:hypothetical protein